MGLLFDVFSYILDKKTHAPEAGGEFSENGFSIPDNTRVAIIV